MDQCCTVVHPVADCRTLTRPPTSRRDLPARPWRSGVHWPVEGLYSPRRSMLICMLTAVTRAACQAELSPPSVDVRQSVRWRPRCRNEASQHRPTTESLLGATACEPCGREQVLTTGSTRSLPPDLCEPQTDRSIGPLPHSPSRHRSRRRRRSLLPCNGRGILDSPSRRSCFATGKRKSAPVQPSRLPRTTSECAV
jgi:hypothetical protein